jgi:predicted RNA-binding Zn ribbon-like protein
MKLLYKHMDNRSTSKTEVTRPEFLWLGGHRALDFLNTRPLIRGTRMELLDSFARLLAWCVDAKFLTAEHADDALARWGTSRGATRTLTMAHHLRDELRIVLDHRGKDEHGSQQGLNTLNDCLRLGERCTQVLTGPGGQYHRHVLVALSKPEDVLRPVAEAAAALLCDVDPTLVRRCDNPECVLYFHDVSKNHARRWCSMALCGNRMKVAAHHRRLRAKHTS